MRLIFMGTPDFAVPCLQSLLDAGHEICAVYTQPDKPKGRGYAMAPPPVKVLAEQHGLPVVQPKTLRTPEAAEELRAFKPACIAVVAYGKLLPREILDIPPFGCINVHASLLPGYRGAAPIQWTVINGEKETGVTTMYMAEGLDTGDMLLREKTAIGPEETAGELQDRLSVMGADLLCRTLEQIEAGTAERIPQGETDTPYAAMLTKEIAQIDWKRPAREIHNQIRGLSPWPVACTTCAGKLFKIHRARILPNGSEGVPGLVSASDGGLTVSCGDGAALLLEEVQYEGGKRMDGRTFLNGRRNFPGSVLGG